MTIATFSLPVDIPWQRIAFSEDMIDPVACDRRLPPRFRSSSAVFSYEPPEDQQRTDGFVVSYLKVACTITGYQPSDAEIRIRERLGRSGWTRADHNEYLQSVVGRYYACYGAMLEVVVAPHPEDQFPLHKYPYFADFDPKKRELYEMVSETGEVMSRSLEGVNVRLGQTTLQSHEVRDSTTLAGELAGAYGNAQTGGQVSAKGSASNTSGTTDLSQQATENIRTTDAARESRETFSHTTQLTQMYHQLDSYHLGTNRAVFFVLPRPHTAHSPLTFVNGPREIEGIQEFMLVVVRPKEMESFCVEAYLETAHLTHDPIPDLGETVRPLTLHISAPITENDDRSYTNPVPGDNSSPVIAGKVIDTSKGGGYSGYPPPPFPGTFMGAGYEVQQPINYQGPSWGPDIKFTVTSDHVHVAATVTGYWDMPNEEKHPASLDLQALVYYKNAVPGVAGYRDGLLITARAICSCSNLFRRKADYEDGLSVVYEKPLGDGKMRPSQERTATSITQANQLQANIHREMIQSLSSVDRYPRGTVSLLDTQMVSNALAAALRDTDAEAGQRLVNWPGVDEKLAGRVTQYVPGITRSALLALPLARQVETFGLTFEEAVTLRRSIADIAAPEGPPPVKQRPQIRVPLLTGLGLREAHQALVQAGLRLGAVTTVDSPLPAGSIVEQKPGPGAAQATSGTEVVVEISSGLCVRLPEVIGLGLIEAGCALRAAGVRSEPTVEGRPGPNAQVVALEPPPGTLITPLTPVAIRLGPKPNQ